ncbi:hypothetical protein [Tenacibaculum geojense]|uniref:Lipoprotein n=1 Tax=Tenacibaculum geojense TaxID=915352 RepID=A0ABW3JP77_9FLAO
MKLIKPLLTVALLVAFYACSDETPEPGTIQLSAKSNITASAGKNAKNQEVIVEEFLVNVSKFELEIDVEHEDDSDDWDDNGYYDSMDEIALDGPFVLDLTALPTNFLDFQVPNATFEELEFEFDKSEDQNSELFNKSIQVKGTINNTPFVFWHDFEEEVEVDFEDEQSDIIVNNDLNSVVVYFDVANLFSVEELANVTDNNEDGVIEISPTDMDGNNELAVSLKNKIKTLISLLDN